MGIGATSDAVTEDDLGANGVGKEGTGGPPLGITKLQTVGGSGFRLSSAFSTETDTVSQLDKAKQEYIEEQIAKRRSEAAASAMAQALNHTNQSSEEYQREYHDHHDPKEGSSPIPPPLSSSVSSSSSSSSSSGVNRPLTDDELLQQILEERARAAEANRRAKAALLNGGSGSGSGSSSTFDVDATESGDRWLTGLAEVELPLDARVSNIERTEIAKRKLMEFRKQDRKDGKGVVLYVSLYLVYVCMCICV